LKREARRRLAERGRGCDGAAFDFETSQGRVLDGVGEGIRLSQRTEDRIAVGALCHSKKNNGRGWKGEGVESDASIQCGGEETPEKNLTKPTSPNTERGAGEKRVRPFEELYRERHAHPYLGSRPRVSSGRLRKPRGCQEKSSYRGKGEGAFQPPFLIKRA